MPTVFYESTLATSQATSQITFESGMPSVMAFKTKLSEISSSAFSLHEHLIISYK